MNFDLVSVLIGVVFGFGSVLAIGRARFREVQDTARAQVEALEQRLRDATTKKTTRKK